MAKASGYAAVLSKNRMSLFLECIEDGTRFAEPVADFKHSRNIPLVCFIINGTAVTHIALGRRGSRAGTGLRRLNFEGAERLPEPLNLSKIFNILPARNKAWIKQRFAYGGLLSDKSFIAIIEAIRNLAPKSSSILERYSKTRIERVERLSSEIKTNLAYQKEAVLTALSIADISRDSIQEWTPPETIPLSFLDGLPTARLREDQMVINDLMKIPGFELIENKVNVTGAAVFLSDSERLTVILANRGYDLRLIQDYLGHRDPKHTVRYTRTAAGRFEGLWP
jgi:hypothetical protein